MNLLLGIPGIFLLITHPSSFLVHQLLKLINLILLLFQLLVFSDILLVEEGVIVF